MIPRDSKERAEFVRLVDLERDAGKSIDKAVADVRGAAAEPTADQYVEWKGLIDEVKGGSVQSQHWALRTLNFFLGFFSSGFFFMLTGGGFIYFAATLHGGQHTAFTFILAVLGIAILLFGTGTLSAGRFSTTTESDWKIQGSLAGGAGVLAIIFGWALLEKHEDMRKAFESQTQFMIFSLEMVEATQSGKPVLVRDKFLLEPKHGFSPVPVSTRTSHFEILVPYQSHSRPCSTKISAKLHFVDPATGKPGDQKPIVDYFDVVLPDGSKCDGTKDVNVENTTDQAAQEETANAAAVELEEVRFKRIPLEKDEVDGTDVARFSGKIYFSDLDVSEVRLPRQFVTETGQVENVTTDADDPVLQ